MSQDPLRVPDDDANPFARPEMPQRDAAINPYAPTSHVSDTEGLESDVEAFRNHYLSHEASIKSIGILYLIPGVLMLLGFLGMTVATIVGAVAGGGIGFGAPDAAEILFVVVIYGGIGLLNCYAGWGIRKFRKGPKVIITILSSIGLLMIPFGTIINGYILYLLHSEKGKVVFSERYQEVIRQTPHIKYKRSIVVKVLLVLVVALITIGIVALFVGG